MIDARNVHATIGKHMLADGMDQVIDLKMSHGSWLVDARDGKPYLDLFSMFASMPVGYNHPTLLENREQIAAAALNKITNSDIYSTQMAEFVDTVGRIAQPDYLPYSFYVEGGALGVENALKTAFGRWSTSCPRKAAIAASPTSTSAPAVLRSVVLLVVRKKLAAAVSLVLIHGNSICGDKPTLSIGAMICLWRKASRSIFSNYREGKL